MPAMFSFGSAAPGNSSQSSFGFGQTAPCSSSTFGSVVGGALTTSSHAIGGAALSGFSLGNADPIYSSQAGLTLKVLLLVAATRMDSTSGLLFLAAPSLSTLEVLHWEMLLTVLIQAYILLEGLNMRVRAAHKLASQRIKRQAS